MTIMTKAEHDEVVKRWRSRASRAAAEYTEKSGWFSNQKVQKHEAFMAGALWAFTGVTDEASLRIKQTGGGEIPSSVDPLPKFEVRASTMAERTQPNPYCYCGNYMCPGDCGPEDE